MTHVTCRLTAKNQDQLWNPTLGNQIEATFLYCGPLDASKEVIHNNNNNNDRLTAFDPGQPG